MTAKTDLLITGAGGFVGHSLCSEAIDRGLRVKAAYRSKPIMIQHELLDPIHLGDLWQPKQNLCDVLQGVDTVVHLASLAHQPDSGDSCSDRIKSHYHLQNVESTRILADAALKSGVRRFIYLSSIKAATDQTKLPLDDIGGENPDDVYGLTKLQAEQQIQTIAHNSAMDYVILRPPLIYGPGVKANFLRLIQLVDRSIPLPLGSVHNRRSYLYVENLVDAILAARKGSNITNQTYYLADDPSLSVGHLAMAISDLLNKPLRLLPVPPPVLWAGAYLFRKTQTLNKLASNLEVSNKRIERDLQWKPPHLLVEGLSKTVEWYRQSTP